MKYVVVYEQAPSNWAAYIPDLPGCVAAADTREGVTRLIREAAGFHLAALRDYEEPIPQPGTWTGEVEVEIPDRETTQLASSDRLAHPKRKEDAAAAQ